MNSPSPRDSFLHEWRRQWPEWAVAERFLAPPQRELAVAWFALLQIWMDAAIGGQEPAPGLAKLAWWQEELRGWAKGARRHPLGELLQAQPANWSELADAMPALRERDALQSGAAWPLLQPLARQLAEAEVALFRGQPANAHGLAADWLAGSGVTLVVVGSEAGAGAGVGWAAEGGVASGGAGARVGAGVEGVGGAGAGRGTENAAVHGRGDAKAIPAKTTPAPGGSRPRQLLHAVLQTRQHRASRLSLPWRLWRTARRTV